MASSEEEAKQWVTSLEKIMSNMENLNSQQKTEQYPSHRYRVRTTGTRISRKALEPLTLAI
jgi:Asp-tRNA(Asn)/Glu-tRNA(Gln) amidotransferase C subunit